jgi:hypothetical protein
MSVTELGAGSISCRRFINIHGFMDGKLNISSQEIGIEVFSSSRYFEEWRRDLRRPVNIISVDTRMVISSSSHAVEKIAITVIFER